MNPFANQRRLSHFRRATLAPSPGIAPLLALCLALPIAVAQEGVPAKPALSGRFRNLEAARD